MERDNVTGVSMRCQQICEFDLAKKPIYVVAILVDLIVPDGCHDIAHLESGLHCRGACFHIRNVNAASFSFFSSELTQLRIAGWKKRESSGGKTTIVLAFGFL